MRSWRETASDGAVVGFIGYVAVALFYSLFDFLASRGTLYTVDLLGKALFRDLRDPAILNFPVEGDLTTIFLYNALHLTAALAIGLTVMALVKLAEDDPSRGWIVLFILVAGFIVTVVAVGILSAPIRPVLPWWSIVVANAVAVVLAGAYVLRKHPHLWHVFGRPGTLPNNFQRGRI